MSDRVWSCKSPLHAQPCWHGRCSCGWATAFDFTAEDVREMLDRHDCPLKAKQLAVPFGGGDE